MRLIVTATLLLFGTQPFPGVDNRVHIVDGDTRVAKLANRDTGMRVSVSFVGTSTMSRKLDHSLDCPNCNTTYLTIPPNVSGHSPICCSTCGAFLGSWSDLESDFGAQGGQNGAFRLDHGHFVRIDRDPMQVHELASGGQEQLQAALIATERGHRPEVKTEFG